ncbi:hypothetical protein PM082_011624 [Marasmius tenuissimus]|nr:hypothetical protein PM082_011624 [Marasmius tenuissimus]
MAIERRSPKVLPIALLLAMAAFVQRVVSHFLLFVIACSCSCVGVLATSGTTPQICSKEYVAEFEDIPALPGADPGLNPPPTPYKDLVYTGFSTNEAGIPPNTGHSIYYGDAVAATILAHGFSDISKADYVQNFDLNSFTFVCVVQSAESLKGVGKSCKIKLTGWKGANQVYKECEFEHPLSNLTIVPKKCETQDFKGVHSVGFETVTSPAVLKGTLITAIDEIGLVVREPCN